MSSFVICFGHQLVMPLFDGLFPAVVRHGLEHFAQHRKADLLLDAVLHRVELHEVLHVDHAVREDLHLTAVHVEHSLVDAARRRSRVPCRG